MFAIYNECGNYYTGDVDETGPCWSWRKGDALAFHIRSCAVAVAELLHEHDASADVCLIEGS